MPETDLASWQAEFFRKRVRARATGREGVYFREQVFGALQVLSDALPEIQEALGEPNFRYFVRELLQDAQPKDALGTTLIEPFVRFLRARPELSESAEQLDQIARALEAMKPNPK